MVFSCFGSGRQSWQLQASKASFLVGSERSHKKNKKTKKTKKKKIRPSLLVGSESDVWLSGLAWS